MTKRTVRLPKSGSLADIRERLELVERILQAKGVGVLDKTGTARLMALECAFGVLEGRVSAAETGVIVANTKLATVDMVRKTEPLNKPGFITETAERRRWVRRARSIVRRFRQRL